MTSQEQVQGRIEFLQKQLDSLEHYLPETYQYLMNEMDIQQKNLMELKIQHFYQGQNDEQQNPSPDEGDSIKGQEFSHWSPGVCQ